MSVRLRPAAAQDIEAIADHIAEDNPQAARRWLAQTRERCTKLGDMPQLGVARPDIHSDLRMFVSGNYLILYRTVEDGVEVVRVLHGARHWEKLITSDRF